MMIIGPLLAAGNAPPLDLPLWSALPFVLLLLCIAILPLVAEHWWHSNRHKLLISLLFALPVALFLLLHGESGRVALWHGIEEYIQFILLLGSLYVISGGILLRCNLRARPAINTAILGIGATLANLIGTTGASMLLIRPFLRTNAWRTHRMHLPIFFIFCVANTGGLLTPLGDPPLFLGFLRGVDFFWTLRLWRQWLLVNGLILLLFFAWDSVALRFEPQQAPAPGEGSAISLAGSINLLLLAGVVLLVLLKGQLQNWPFVGEGGMVLLGLASLRWTPKQSRQENGFTWFPIVEVAVLFVGIFVAMVPALAWLSVHGKEFGLSRPWQFFWLTGGLSSCLDNAPTYVTFATIAAEGNPLAWLMRNRPDLLAAVSCGAVFMGALTYIGNGPNFMIKAIADEMGNPTPSFFGYFGRAAVVLVPLFLIVTFVFFRGGA